MDFNEYLENRKTLYSDIISNKRYGKLTGLVSVELNITELCNRRCSFCPRVDPKIYPNKRLFMSNEIVKKIAIDLSLNDFNGIVHLCGFGEPLLHPDIVGVAKILKEYVPNLYIELTTNTDLMTGDLLAQIKDYVSNIIFDCYDGAHQVDNIFKIVQENNFTKYIIKELWSNITDDKDFLENNFNNRAGAVNIIKQKNYENRPCYIPFYKLMLDWNGEMLLCCNDWFRQQKGLGNIKTNTIYDLWHSNELTQIRNNLQNGRRIDKACKNCNVCGDIIGKKSVDLLRAS